MKKLVIKFEPVPKIETEEGVEIEIGSRWKHTSGAELTVSTFLVSGKGVFVTFREKTEFAGYPLSQFVKIFKSLPF